MNRFRKLIASPGVQHLSLAVYAFLYALNYEIFIHYNDFAPSGVNGIATMIQYLFNFSVGYLSLLINIPMLIVAAIILNRKFSLRSLTFVVVFSVSILLLQKIDLSPIIYKAEDCGEKILASVAGGFFAGLLYSLSLRAGGCTGGTDIVAAMVNHKRPEYDLVWVIFTINTAVALSSFFVYGMDYQPVILCIIYCFICSHTGDTILKGGRSAAKFEVITTHPEELAAELMEKLKHSCTILSAEGAYSHRQESLLVCVVNPRQVVDFKAIVRKYDGTFAYVSTVNETFGNFKRIR